MGIDLVTLAEYKAYAGINSTNQDTEIKAIIPKVSQLVKTICRRTFVDFVDESKIQVFKGGPSLSLVEFPILNVMSVEYSEDYGLTYSLLEDGVDYVVDTEIGEIEPISGMFAYKLKAYKVTYTGGYEEGIPADLKLAVLDLVKYYLKNDMSVHSNKAPGTNSVQIEYITTTNLPAHIKRVLDQYSGSYV